MENPLQSVWNYRLLFLFFLIASLSFAQSCVCYQKDLLNDFKDTDFIGLVTVTSKKAHALAKDVDVIGFTTQEIIKGKPLKEVMIFQKQGNGKNNDACRLFLKKGDQLLLYASKKNESYYTLPCYRNRMLGNTSDAFASDIENHLSILRQLALYQQELAESTTRCKNTISDWETNQTIENIDLKLQKSRLGLYSVKFTEDDKIDRIDVISSFNGPVDNKVRIALIKKNWSPCKLKENRKLILGYFYKPPTSNREAHLSPL